VSKVWKHVENHLQVARNDEAAAADMSKAQHVLAWGSLEGCVALLEDKKPLYNLIAAINQ